MLIRLAEEHAKGEFPAPAAHADWYRVRSAFALVAKDKSLEEGAGWLLTSEQRAAE